jgi:preprotein translocase subunit SecE
MEISTETMKIQDKEQKKTEKKAFNVSFFSKVLNFISDIKAEFEKITWTNKTELLFLTKIVVASTFLFSFFIYLVDIFVKSSLTLIGNIFHLLFS